MGDRYRREKWFFLMSCTGQELRHVTSAVKRQSRAFRPERRSNALLPSARTQNRRPGRHSSSRDLAQFRSAWVADDIQEPGLANIRPDREAAARQRLDREDRSDERTVREAVSCSKRIRASPDPSEPSYPFPSLRSAKDFLLPAAHAWLRLPWARRTRIPGRNDS